MEGITMIEAQEFQLPIINTDEQVNAVKVRLSAIPGVVNVTGHRPTKIFTVQWRDPATWEQIKAAIYELGYTPKYK